MGVQEYVECMGDEKEVGEGVSLSLGFGFDLESSVQTFGSQLSWLIM